MAFPFFRKVRITEPVLGVYTAIVAQSRRPVFYAEWGVPDTVTGRFDMISLHMAFVFRRLRSDDKATREFAQNLFDCFFADMDRSLREMGVGDLSVGKRIAKMSSLFYGLLGHLSTALDNDDRAELESVLARNIYAGEPHHELASLADYVLLMDDLLSTQNVATIMSGTVTFGDVK